MSIRKQGDTLPPLVIDCFDGSRDPANLENAQTLKVFARQRGVQVWEKDATGFVEGGTITLPLDSDITGEPGTYYLKVFAVWPNGDQQHYPPGDDYLTLTVTR